MRRDPRAYLADVVEATALVRRFTEGRDLGAYRADTMLRSAVERQLEITGEALSQLRGVDPELAARIPEITRVVGFRNVLAHGYDVVDDEVAWKAATVDAPKLAEVAAALLNEMGPSPG